MNRNSVLASAVLLATAGVFFANCQAADPKPAKISHPFIAQCFRAGKICIVSPKGEIEWEYPARNVQDVWKLPNGNLLFCHRTGAKEVTVKDKKVVWEYKAPNVKGLEIHSCQPLPNGNVLICECGTSRLVEVDRQGKVAKEIKLTTTTTKIHDQFRMARKTAKGTYVVAFTGEGVVKELDGAGKIVRTIDLNALGVKSAKLHGVLRLKNGNTLITTGGTGTIVEIDPKDKIVWKFEPKDQPEGFKCKFVCGLQRLSNGNTVTGWYGGNPQFFEITPDKKVVWKVYDKRLSAISGLFLLDAKGDVTKGEVLK
ncbi:MAG: hypothetical protein QGG42_08630 [Phycisphaerae bacterium]|jgi:hypothetical protein|nr:hypothetical protein [Phycisphaerae bacterium]